MFDVIPGRDDPENLKILKKTSVEVRQLKRTVGFFVSDEIRSVGVSTSRDELRS